MKYFKLIVILLTFLQPSFADEPKTIKSAIKEVTVFLNRAQITSQAAVLISSGNNDVIIEGLPAQLDAQSIQVSGKGDFIIMGVKHRINYMDPNKESKEIKALEDSLEKYQIKIQDIKDKKDVLQKEEAMILMNQSIKGEEKGVLPAELKNMSDFFRSRLFEIRESQSKYDRTMKDLNERYAKIYNQLNVLNSMRNRPSSQIIVTLNTKSTVNAMLEIRYIVAEAGWYPVYDIRAKDTKNPIQLNYKAEVYQNTGINWENVKLKLSTSNPSLGGTKPEMGVWGVDIYEPVQYQTKKYKTYDNNKPAAANIEREIATESYDVDKKEEYNAGNTADYTTVVETTLSAEFDIALLYTVQTGNVPTMVDIQSHDVPATYKHFAVPKLDKDAFLVAHVTGWEDLNLLPGKSNIFFEGTFVGEAYIDPNNTNDTLVFSLGRDKRVVIQRTRLKDFSSKSFIGLNRKEEYAFEIAVRNTKKDAIEITLEDQIPVSRNSMIEVELVDAGGAEVNKDTGKLTWKISVPGQDTKKMVFKFVVKYPKNKTITGL